MRLGFHVSIAGGLDRCIQRARIRRCTTLQMFTGAPVQWARTEISDADGAAFAERLAALNIRPHFVHAKYLLNVSSPDPALRLKSVEDLAIELEMARRLRAAGVVLHLGSVGAEGTIAEGVERVAEAVNTVCERVPEGPSLILENSAGQGNIVGARFTDLRRIIDAADFPERIRICVDTAHAFGAGYPLHTEAGLQATVSEMAGTFGFDRLALLHVNDSKVPFDSGRDRHWHIGRGEIGREGMARIVNHPRFTHLPFIMETPGTESDDITNMRRIRRIIRKENRPPLPPLPKDLR